MPSRRDLIRMTDDEIRAFLETSRRWLQVATIGRDGTPHLSPMAFTMLDGLIHFAGYRKSQKMADLRRDPRITVLVEDGDQYTRLRGVEIRGRAELIDDPVLTSLALGKGSAKHFLLPDPGDTPPIHPTAAKRTTVRVHPQRIISWDHTKLGGVY